MQFVLEIVMSDVSNKVKHSMMYSRDKWTKIVLYVVLWKDLTKRFKSA